MNETNPAQRNTDPKTETNHTTTKHILLPYNRPPLTANDRLHWAKKAKTTKKIRTSVHWLAKAAKLPKNLTHATIGLHYQPTDKRRRDPSNLMPTQKAAIDGLVDYGLVDDDCPPFVTELMPKIHQPNPANKQALLWLTISYDERR